MVFAAGLGTRLKPLTDTLPKALVPVCGQPLLYHVLTKLVAAGYDDVVVNVHHFSDRIVDYLAAHDWGARIRVSDERSFLRETGGGIRYAEPLLRGEDQPFLVHNVDIVSNLDFKWLRDQWRPGALAALVVSERQTQRYFLFDDDLRLAGWTNLRTGEVRSPYGDIDPSRYRKLAFAGIHLISPDIFGAFGALGYGERFSITDFYLKACAEYPVYAIVPPGFQMVDVGKIETLSDAERTIQRADLLRPRCPGPAPAESGGTGTA